jgi:hypothetical protein
VWGMERVVDCRWEMCGGRWSIPRGEDEPGIGSELADWKVSEFGEGG